MIAHHPDSALLLDYAAGSLAEPVALAVASHVSFCPECRVAIDRMTAVGGELLRKIDPSTDGIDDLLETTLARLGEPEPLPAVEPALDEETRVILPPPLRPYVGGSLSDLTWHWRGPSMREATLAVPVPRYRVSLFRLPPGGAVPIHGHRGHEYTVLLQGVLCEAEQRYSVGDFIAADQDDHHVQRADRDSGCLCLAVLDAPVRLTGPLSRLLNPFLKI